MVFPMPKFLKRGLWSREKDTIRDYFQTITILLLVPLIVTSIFYFTGLISGTIPGTILVVIGLAVMTDQWLDDWDDKEQKRKEEWRKNRN